MKRIIIAFTLITSISIYAQSEKIYNHGKIYWGTFDGDKGELVGNLDFHADIIQIKLVDTDYFIYAKDIEGKNFKSKFARVGNKKDVFMDDSGKEYMIFPEKNSINILCLKPLVKGKNLLLMMQIKDVY